MVKIIVETNYENSPKSRFLRDFNIAFMENTTGFIEESVSDDIVWDLVGDRIIEGKPAFTEALVGMSADHHEELIIDTIITHGKTGAVNGTFKLSNGTRYAFCDIYAFATAKGNLIRSITSYIIQLS